MFNGLRRNICWQIFATQKQRTFLIKKLIDRVVLGKTSSKIINNENKTFLNVFLDLNFSL